MAPEHIVDFRRLIHNLIHGDEGKCYHTPVDDRSIAGPCCADGDARKRPLGDGGGAYPVGTKFFDQFVLRAGREMKCGWVSLHLLDERVHSGLCIGDFWHSRLTPVIFDQERKDFMEESGTVLRDSESGTHPSARTIGIDCGRRFDRRDSEYLVGQDVVRSKIPTSLPNVGIPPKRHPIPREFPVRRDKT